MVGRQLPPQMQRRYMDAVAGFAEYFKPVPPGRLSADNVTEYLLHLAMDQKLPLAEQKTVVCGLRFFYGVTLGKKWAEDLSLVVPVEHGGEVRFSKMAPFGSEKRVRERMIEDMTLRGLSPRTHQNYLQAVGRFIQFHANTPPGRLGPEDVKAYQLHLIRERKLAHKSVTVIVCALRFLYRVTLQKSWAIERIVYGKRPLHLPDIPSPEEVAQLLASALHIRHRVMLAAAYGGGLRREEVACLRIKDIDIKRMVIHVIEGKGRKDRQVMLSPGLLRLIQEYSKTAKPRHWLFPGQKRDTHISGEAISLACREAWKKSGLERSITVRSLRHGFATHLMENGIQLSVIQRLLGHANLRTTQIYTHLATHTICSTPSPLDLLPSPPSE